MRFSTADLRHHIRRAPARAAAPALLALCLTAHAAAASPPAGDDVRLAFRLDPKLPVQHLTIALKSSVRRRAALAKVRDTYVWRGMLAMPRFDADAHADAIRAARSALTRLASEPADDAARTPEERAKREIARTNAKLAAARILAVAGEASDAALIVATCPCRGLPDKLFAVAIAAYLENRLGVLEGGKTAELARGTDPQWRVAASTALHEYGSNAGDGTLVTFVADPANAGDAFEPAAALFDTENPAVLRAMRSAFDRAPTAALRAPSAAYLLAYGTAADRAKVGAHELDAWAAKYVSFLTDDPVGLADMLTKDNGIWAAVSAVPALRDIPAGRRRAVADELETAATGGPYGDTFTGRKSFARPSTFLAAKFFGSSWVDSETPWVPWITDNDERQAQFAKTFVAGNLAPRSEWQLDYLPGEKLRALFEAAKATDAFPMLDLYYAAHRIATRAFLSDLDDFHDGIERRPYALRSAAHSGAISGILEMQPSFAEKKLRLALHVVQRAYAHCGSMFGIGCGSDEESEAYRYITDDGRALLGAIALHAGGKTIGTRATGRTRNGWLLYEADADIGSLANTYLTVQLNFFEQKPVLTYDLFASDYARTLRTLARRAQAHDRTAFATNRAADWSAAAGYYAAMGRYGDAWPRYQKAIELRPGDAGVWSAAAQMYAEAGDHDRAASVLGAEVQQRPHDTAAWRDLTSQLYYAGRYRDSAAAAARVLAREPDDRNVQLLQATALYLAGRRREAGDILEGHAQRASARIAPLWYLSEKAIGSERVADAEAELAVLRRTASPAIQQTIAFLTDDGQEKAADALQHAADACKAQTYVAYHALFKGDRQGAATHFRAALATAQFDQAEYRMAQTELAALEVGPAAGPLRWLLVAIALALAVAGIRGRDRVVALFARRGART